MERKTKAFSFLISNTSRNHYRTLPEVERKTYIYISFPYRKLVTPINENVINSHSLIHW